jgi:hypothetical protein
MNSNENSTQSTVVAQGEAQVSAVRWMTIRRALKFEIERGTKMTRIPIVPMLQREGITTKRTKKAAYADLNRAMVEAGFEDLPLNV